jgi:hypothetical protein
MVKRFLLLALALCSLLSCGGHKGDGRNDREANGGFVRLTIQGKPMHDRFFAAQFTPAGDLFKNDNLQLYNFNSGSEKYPQLLINVEHLQPELKKWEGQALSADVVAFTVSKYSKPLTSSGQVMITRVTEEYIDGTFSGELTRPDSSKTFPIRGEFRAALKLNI